MLRTVIVSLFTALICAVLSPLAFAQIEIDITQGNLDPVPIAIPDFTADDTQTVRIGVEMADVIRGNLERSGLFRSLDKASFIDGPTDINYQPKFANWRVIKADTLLTGQIVRESANRIRVEYRLWDVVRGEQLAGLRLATSPDNWRRIAHKISDTIYEKVTGEAGYFDSRIVFVDETGPKTDRTKRLTIMDQDGYNPQYLATSSNIVLTPRFSPNSQKITYLSYEATTPQVYLLDIETGRREVLGQFPGMTFSPRFSPDGRQMVLSLMSKGNSDLYLMDLGSRSTKRLTDSPAIDVSASFSPDGRRIVFNSDRGGSPQLYTMRADGGDVKRISFGEGRYSAPVWSPRGDKIAFVKSQNGRFSIGVINPDGTGERLLTESFLDEGPTWSPNGRVILFTRETRGRSGSSQIWSVDITGRNLQRVLTPGGASDPAWSPMLP